MDKYNTTRESVEEQIRILDTVIKQTKQKISYFSPIYLFWGILVVVSNLIAILLDYFEFVSTSLIWLVSMVVGLLYTWICYKRLSVKFSSTSILYTLGYIWFGFFISCMLAIPYFLGTMEVYIYPIFIIFMYTLGIFITGVLIKFNPFIIGACINWSSIVLAWWGLGYYDTVSGNLLNAFCVVVSFIIPGYLLSKTSKSA